jgi:hypothetical protein
MIAHQLLRCLLAILMLVVVADPSLPRPNFVKRPNPARNQTQRSRLGSITKAQVIAPEVVRPLDSTRDDAEVIATSLPATSYEVLWTVPLLELASYSPAITPAHPGRAPPIS